MSDNYLQDPTGDGKSERGTFHVVCINDDGTWRIIYITRDPELAQRAVDLSRAHEPGAQHRIELMTDIPRPRC
jgi:hypothetical protein